MFERRGYHETRIADITASARMAVGSFYTYFDSKEEIFEALLIEMENLVYDDPGRQLPESATPSNASGRRTRSISPRTSAMPASGA